MKIFYRPEQSARTNKSFSPSAGKPKLFVEKALETFAIKVDIVDDFEPCTISEIAKAHDHDFVIDVLNGKRQNGFGNTLDEVNETLPYTSGSMREALHHAFKFQTITCSPTSGFHHACYKSAGAFCTFNGLMIAALDLIQKYPQTVVGIFDLDNHYGNGTDDIIRELGLQEKIKHYTLGRDYLSKEKKEDWLDQYPSLVKEFLNHVDVVILQAGADPHINDPLGGLFTTDELENLHSIFFEAAAERKIGVAWNLAGGYQEDIEDVLEIHMNTVKAALVALESLPRIPSDMTELEDLIQFTTELSERELIDYLKLLPGVDEISPVDHGHEVNLDCFDISIHTQEDMKYQVLDLLKGMPRELKGAIVRSNYGGMLYLKENRLEIRVQNHRERYDYDVDIDYVIEEIFLIQHQSAVTTDQQMYRRLINLHQICQSARNIGINLFSEFHQLLDQLKTDRKNVFEQVHEYLDQECLSFLEGCGG
ncbi:MAG: hypothetical protein Fur0010_25720 [Bdellovibrio sp.]